MLIHLAIFESDFTAEKKDRERKRERERERKRERADQNKKQSKYCLQGFATKINRTDNFLRSIFSRLHIVAIL